MLANFKGAICSCWEDIFIRKERCLLTDLNKELTLKDETVSFCSCLYVADPATSSVCSGTSLSSENSSYMHYLIYYLTDIVYIKILSLDLFS